MNFFESTYAKSEELTNVINHWLLNGGNEIIHTSAFWGVWALATMCLFGAFFEKRNYSTREITNKKTTTHFMMNVFNWIFGSIGAFIMFNNGSTMLGLLLLGLVYIVPQSRSLMALSLTEFLTKIPNLFYEYSWKEKLERKKKIKLYLHEKLRCDYPDYIA